MSDPIYYDVKRPEVIAEKFDDEYVIVNLHSGAYYGLRGTAAAIWEQIVNGATHDEIVASLGERFDAAPAALDRAVTNLVRELEQENLIVPQPGPAAKTPGDKAGSPPPATRTVFTAPVLEKHSDMQEVLQLDPIHEVDESGWPTPNAGR